MNTAKEKSASSAAANSEWPARRLSTQYRVIGEALLNYEMSFPLTRGTALSSALLNFRRDVSFLKLEVLESYFEDLLDPDIKDDFLFIKRRSLALRFMFSYLPFLGLMGALGIGLYLTKSGTHAMASVGVMGLLAAPFLALWYILPGGSLRRMRFARVLTQEISRRRGHDSDGAPASNLRLVSSDPFWGARAGA